MGSVNPETTPPFDPQTVIRNAGDRSHLTREKAIASLERALDTTVDSPSTDTIEILQHGALTMLSSDQWEQRLGGFRLAKLLISHDTALPSDDFIDSMIQACDDRLEDSEVRVRWAVGEVVGALCQHQGITIWKAMQERILSSIHSNFDRENSTHGGSEASSTLPCSKTNGNTCISPPSDSPTTTTAPPLLSTLLQQTYRVEPPGVGEMRHGTEGWKCLETSFRALQHVMEGCGPAFASFVDESLRALVYRALLHPNRFVREICHYILGSVCQLLDAPQLQELGTEIASKLGLGLSDNWSQVRYAASVATRTFLLATEPYQETILPLLIPHLCLNRYYVAEGVRLYSQETWQLIVKDQGRAWVARCAPWVVSYYIEQSKANNHAVREAACACIAELMVKVDRDAVAPHVPRLLRALLTCFRDASWPVRDAACLACGRCVKAFSDESREVIDKLYELWFAHLWDNIFSVREDSAIALGDTVRAYGNEALKKIVPKVDEMLPMAKNQPAESTARGGLENTTLFGVAAERRQQVNDAETHKDRTMFSCGSLAPKLKAGGDGCMDHGFAREKEPWEATDGAIYMVRELAEVAPEAVPPFLPMLVQIARLTHFSHCLNLQETLWKCLPRIAKGVGKKAFKPSLDEFLGPLFAAATCGNRLCEVAAGHCIGEIRDFIGPGIFEGRLDEEQRRVLHGHADIPCPRGPLS